MTQPLTKEQIAEIKYLADVCMYYGADWPNSTILSLITTLEARDAAFEEMLENVLTDHWLAGIECNHEAKTDKANCSCSLVNLPVMNSIGEAANTWVKHVVAEFQKARSAIAHAESEPRNG